MKLMTKFALWLLKRDRSAALPALSAIAGEDYAFVAAPVGREWFVEWPAHQYDFSDVTINNADIGLKIASNPLTIRTIFGAKPSIIRDMLEREMNNDR